MKKVIKIISLIGLIAISGFFMQEVANAVAAPTCGGVLPTNFTTTANSGSVEVVAFGVANATSLVFPAWSESGGQNDIVWYPGIHVAGGDWKVNVDLASHPGLGKIFVDVYMSNASATNVFCGGIALTRTSGGTTPPPPPPPPPPAPVPPPPDPTPAPSPSPSPSPTLNSPRSPFPTPTPNPPRRTPPPPPPFRRIGPPPPPPPPTTAVISSISPSSARRGVTTLVINGEILTKTVQFRDSDDRIHRKTGSVNSAKTQTTILVPADLAVGPVAVRVYINDTTTIQSLTSNAKWFTVTSPSGTPPPPPPPPGPPPPILGQKNLGGGVFPDVVWKDGFLWIAVKESTSRITLYKASPDLTNIIVFKTFDFTLPDNSFPRLTVSNNIVWLAYRDGRDIILWRSDTGAIQNLGQGGGNDPVALGFGSIAWQTTASGFPVMKRNLTGGSATRVRSGAPTGLSRILSSGNVKLIDEDRNAIRGYTRPWWAGSLTVVEGVRNEDGDIAFFKNDLNSKFSLFAGQESFTPHAAFDGKDLYAISTWGNAGVRVATLRWTQTSGGPGDGDVICDPWPTDPNLQMACLWWRENFPQGSPPISLPGADPGNPTVLSMTGASGLDVAYNSPNQITLVVGGDRDITGALLDAATLEPKGANFRIDQGPGNLNAANPKAVYNPAQDKFLVVWEDERPSANRRSTYGRFVSGGGVPQGADFVIRAQDAFLSSVILDQANQRYVVLLSDGSASIIKLVGLDGAPGHEARLKVEAASVTEVKPSLAYNSTRNEYWITYSACTATCTNKLARVDAVTMQKVGEPIVISDPALHPSGIAYSPREQGALIAFEDERNQGHGIYGLSISDGPGSGSGASLQVSDIFPLLITDNGITAEVNGLRVEYNPWTQTFFFSAYDDSAVVVAETDLGGYVYGWGQVIALDSRSDGIAAVSWISRLFGSKKAQAAASDNSGSTFDVTQFGTTAAASRDSGTVVVANTYGANWQNLPRQSALPGPTFDVTAPNDSGKKLGEMIVNIYRWSLALSAIFAMLMMVMGGYLMMTAGGNASQSEKGKGYVLSAIVGMGLLFGSYLILNTINPELVKFEITTPSN